MKGRLYVSGLILIILVVAVSTLLFVNKKVNVAAASTVFVNQPYYVHFSKPLDEKSIEKGKVNIKHADGKESKAVITLQQNKTSLSILHETPGDYILHVNGEAFQKSSSTSQKVEYKVIDQIEQLSTEQDLQDYFQNILNSERRNVNNRGVVMEESATVSSEASAADRAGADASHSTTNNQVEGIEEGDIVVTDGRYIYSIVDQRIIIMDAKNPQKMKQVNAIPLNQNSTPIQLMIHQDMLIIIYDQYIEMKPSKSTRYIGGTSMTKAAFYNIKDPANPKMIREIGQDGYMNGIRKYEDVLYIVTNKTPDYWIMTEKENVELKPYQYDSAKGEEVEPMDIRQLSILPGTMEPNYTIISAIDLKNLKDKKIETKGYLGGSSTLYMSENALYLTAFKFEMPKTLELDPSSSSEATTSIARDMIIAPTSTNTDIFKFAINGTEIELAATSSVSGTILNQFSMDEYNGHFRIATTDGYAWGREANSKNHLFILDENLKKVGELTDLAKGERIYSARFMGDKVYMVTFKETDPLFVIDASNASRPKVLGELKIPGFSNYLHPLDENHLVGIGYDTEVRVDDFTKEPFVITKGMKISLFDVTDFHNPKEQDMVVIGGRGTYSEVQYNHKALFRNSQYQYFGFPVSIYEGKGEHDIVYKGSGAQVYEITDEHGIQVKGDLVVPSREGEQYEDWESSINRLLYIDNVLYTISKKEVKSYDLQSFKQLGTLQIK
ncbi:beta-propeller domain-containing protein [Ureibacillus composti]